jgi:hypothetical protein
MATIATVNAARYPGAEYFPQDIDALELLLWGSGPDVPPEDPRPIHAAHPLFRTGRVRFFLDPAPWIEYLRDFDFSFGTRIHGSIAAVLAGTPTVVLAHDSRTLELARYFEIPHRLVRDVSPLIDAAELYADADSDRLVAGHPARFAIFAAYLRRHGLEHAFDAPEPSPTFAARVAATAWPAPVSSASLTTGRGQRWSVKRARRSARRLLRTPWVRQARTALARRGSRREDGR